MQIYIRYADRAKNILIDLETSDIIEFVKEWMKNRSIYLSDRQDFDELNFHWKKLEDNKALADYNIQKESTLYFWETSLLVIIDCYYSPMIIFIKTLTGKEFVLDVQEGNIIVKVK